MRECGLLREQHRRLIVAALPGLAFFVLHLWMGLGRVGPYRAPGLEGEGIYGALLAGAIARRWLRAEALPGVADVPLEPTAYWPASPLGALAQAMLPVDPGFALGVVMFLMFVLAGMGPWLLARKQWPDAPAAALLGGLVAQTSPVVLRALPGADLAALSLGPLALGLAWPRAALVCGLASVPTALALGVAGIYRRSAWLLLGALPALALAFPSGPLAGGLRVDPAAAATVPAYYADEGALFPLPPRESAPFRGDRLWLDPAAASDAPPALHAEEASQRSELGALLIPLQRLHGGAAPAIGLALGLLFARSWAVAGLAALATLTVVGGWQLVPGEAVFDPVSAARQRGILSSVPGGVLSWGVPVVLCGAIGLAAAARRLRRWAWILAPLPVLAVVMENPALTLPAVALPPDPMGQSLTTLDEGAVVVFPSPEPPWFMGTRTTDRLRFDLARAGRRLAGGAADAVLVALLDRTRIPADASAAEAVWTHRDAEPFETARAAGARYLLVDLGAIPPAARPGLDGWLAERVGMPVSRVDERLLYDLAAGPAKLPPPADLPTPRLPPLPPGVTPLPELPG